MKKQWRALCMAWGMFCIVPCPSRKWDETARSWMIVWFPLVGLLVGGVWLLLTLLPASMLTAALLCAAPFVVTGFLHLDGYMDCCDAILSRRELAVRQKILELCPDFEEIIETTAGSTVTSHCGPGTLGVLFIRSK